MNKYREALNVLSKCCIGFAEWVAPYVNKELSFDKVNANVALLEQLVDRAEPLIVDSENCPKCGRSFVNYEGCWDSDLLGDFCQFCGHALERGDSDPSPK